ncbi:AraC family transcriptional regulator [Ruania zhangjianzhongii]|uniref:AraC family transcriptional regulator n=1 Tax=Ruania zhangjianzhongii TaxID=2603206 RepID=UPI0011C96F18|nr:AraC family transcriptional regulator [Ruania zhangjianzhongii]
MGDIVNAWHPDVPLVQEVLHATFRRHSYPTHTHDSWTVLLIDEGAVAYRLDGAERHAEPSQLTLLPPGVPHDGQSATPGHPFRKRVIYLDPFWLPPRSVDAAAKSPWLCDDGAVQVARYIHGALSSRTDTLSAEYGIHKLQEVAQAQFEHTSVTTRDIPLARRLRELLDDRLTERFTIAEAARTLRSHPNHLVRAFSDAYGIPPHRYVIGRRVDAARRLLLTGMSPANAAAAAGFYDQAHLTRHFRKLLGVTPVDFLLP